jgi:hypothetical protein
VPKLRNIEVPRITTPIYITFVTAQMGFLLGSALLVITGALANVVIGTLMGTLSISILTLLTRLFVLDRRILHMGHSATTSN